MGKLHTEAAFRTFHSCSISRLANNLFIGCGIVARVRSAWRVIYCNDFQKNASIWAKICELLAFMWTELLIGRIGWSSQRRKNWLRSSNCGWWINLNSRLRCQFFLHFAATWFHSKIILVKAHSSNCVIIRLRCIIISQRKINKTKIKLCVSLLRGIVLHWRSMGSEGGRGRRSKLLKIDMNKVRYARGIVFDWDLFSLQAHVSERKEVTGVVVGSSGGQRVLTSS